MHSRLLVLSLSEYVGGHISDSENLKLWTGGAQSEIDKLVEFISEFTNDDTSSKSKSSLPEKHPPFQLTPDSYQRIFTS